MPLSSVPTTSAEVVTVGVDTHKDVHVAVALDGLGRRLGTLSVPTSPVGYKELVDWANGFGPLERVGVEGTGSFGCGLARFLQAKGIEVFEVKFAPGAVTSTAAANPIPSTPKRRHARYWQAPRLAGPKAPMARSR